VSEKTKEEFMKK